MTQTYSSQENETSDEDDVIFLTVDEVIELHDDVIRRHTPTEPRDILNRGLLESAVAQPQQSFGGQALYPTLPDISSGWR